MSKLISRNPTANEIIAFVHIEKAAGTTLVNIFRREFNVRFCEVRPLRVASGKEFTAEDMKNTLMINPFTIAITGHAVKPFTDLQDKYTGIKYITLMRDPIKRYVSHYQYWVEKMGKKLHFEQFLELDYMRNFQTKKIAGIEDVQLAKKILSTKFLLVGFVEQFDEFITMLGRASSHRFNPSYARANKAKSTGLSDAILAEYREEILERNRLDVELYDFASTVIMPRQRRVYHDRLDAELQSPRAENLYSGSSDARKYLYYLYYLYKRLYFQPVTGLIRKINGLPAKGTYAIKKMI